MLSDQLQDILDHLPLLQYEMVLMGGAIILLIGGLLTKRTVIIKALFALTCLLALFTVEVGESSKVILTGFVNLDGLTGAMKLLFAGTAVWVVLFPSVKPRSAEFYFLLLAIMAGSVLMLSANHLLMVYLAVELTSFASYLITNFNLEKKSFEAGMKYLLFGGASAAVSLYGASLIYGFTGTLVLTDMDFALISNPDLLNIGILTFLGGLLFKIGLVPFHLWTPSTYEAAPTESLPILTSFPKIGALVLLHRVLMQVDLLNTGWLLGMMEVLGIATIVIGTLGAMRQVSAKRLVAYGAIAHSGFLLASLLIPGFSGLSAFVWYSVIYTLMNLAIFYWLALFEKQSFHQLDDFRGVGSQQGFLGALMVIIIIALVGLPPTAGFTAKFYLFTSMWGRYEAIQDPLMLVYFGVAVLSVVFSLFFYLKIPYYYFLKSPKKDLLITSDIYQRLLATIFAGVMLWVFFKPDLLNNIAENIKLIDW